MVPACGSCSRNLKDRTSGRAETFTFLRELIKVSGDLPSPAFISNALLLMRQQPSRGRPRVGGSQAARRAAAHERKHLPACSAAQGYLNCDMINKRTLKIGSSDNYSRRLREVDFLSQTLHNYRAHGGGRLVGHVHEPARSEKSERDPGRFRRLVTATAAGRNPAACPAFSCSGSSPCRPARPANSERTQSDVEFEAHQLVTSATQRFLSSVRTISGVSFCVKEMKR